ncbi:hypothetical protein LJC31_06855 [Synergistaceae bacterium OttesenSCG-928-I11]|nr:hypothetical protein [Synergistaceae bacterium OttesenSCG-928-I11]
MRIRLDDEELVLDDDIVEEGKEEIYEEVKRIASTRGRVITGTVLDGEPIDDIDVFLSISSGQDIQFISQSVRALVIDSLAEGAKYLPTLLGGLGNVATRFEAGDDKEAQGMLVTAIEGINWLFGVFERSCGLLGITAESLVSGDFGKDSGNIKQVLDEMTSAMEGGKNLKIAFVIRDRLIPAMECFAMYWDEVARTLEAPLH